MKYHQNILTLLVVATIATTSNGQTVLPDFSSATFSNSLRIDNPYHPLQVGQIREYDVLETDPESGEVETERIVIQTLDEIRVVNGIDARVVRDRVFNSDDQIIEDTFDWFAQDDAGNVWYMGESVTDYHYDEDGNFLNTTNPGEWEAGVDGALPGHIMPAVQNVGAKFYAEFYAGEAVDEVEILEVGGNLTIPPFQNYSGEFTDVLKMFDTTALDPESLEHKFYAPGIGKIASNTIVDGMSIGGESLVRFVVPEPSAQPMVLTALIALLYLRRRR